MSRPATLHSEGCIPSPKDVLGCVHVPVFQVSAVNAGMHAGTGRFGHELSLTSNLPFHNTP